MNIGNIGKRYGDKMQLQAAIDYGTGAASAEGKRLKFREDVRSGDNVSTIINSLVSYPYTPSSYKSPYITDLKYSDAYIKAPLIGYTMDKPSAGIILNNVADANGLSSILIGDNGTTSSPNTTVFDNLINGIFVENSNIRVNNCTFQHPANLLGTDKGIFIQNGSENIVDIRSSGSNPKNAFFDLSTAITVEGSKKTSIINCEIRSTQDVNDIDNSYIYKGNKGISVGAYNLNNIINIESNHIYNVRNGIYLLSSKDKSSVYSTVTTGKISVLGNSINDQLLGATDATGNEYVENAINLASLYVNEGNDINCNYNTIKGAFNGIKISNWNDNVIKVYGNNPINLKTDPSANAVNNEYYGICLEASSGIGSIVSENVVTGSFNVNNQVYYNQTGILLRMQSNTELGCNTVSGNMHGFRFYGSNPQTKWWDNTMIETNQYGMTVEEGFIGTQGIADAAKNNYCGSNNNWNTANISGGGWDKAKKQYMTNAINSVLTQSTLVILDKATNPELNPTNSAYSTDNITPGFKYTVGDGTLQLINSQIGTCDRCAGATNYRLSNTKFDAILEEIAQGIINLPADEAVERLKVMQQQLYEMLKEDPEIGKNSSSLQQFIYDNHLSSLDFIHLIGKFIAEGNMDNAKILLNNWDNSSDDRVDESYRVYYEWVVKMYKDKEWKPVEEDIRRLYDFANRCPLKDGVVVYAFRNLYNAITQRINKFENNCDGQLAGRGVKPQKQFIRLKPKPVKDVNPVISTIFYPNPADNIVNVKANNIKSIVVSDVTGKVVLETSGNGLKQFNTSKLVNGLYIVKYTTSNGLQASSKLIVQHY